MSAQAKHFITIGDDLNVTFEDLVKWKQDLLNHKGKRVFVTLNKIVKHRSNRQNRYFHSVICKYIADEMGVSEGEAKDALKLEFLRFHISGNMFSMRQTSSLSTAEFEDFNSKCRMLASQMYDCYVPLPNEVQF